MFTGLFIPFNSTFTGYNKKCLSVLHIFHTNICYGTWTHKYRQKSSYSTYVHSYSFHRSTHSNGSGQITFAQGLFDGQLRSKLRAIVACPHCVPFIAGGNGKCFPSNLFNEKRRRDGYFFLVC